jgi:large subunit ribosomal protein L15
MQLHELKPRHKSVERKRVGRGGKKGTYSGRGVKGQSARSGRKFEPSIRLLIKRYPKLRGYKFRVRNLKPAVVNIEVLEKKFESGDTINPQTLTDKGLIKRIKGKLPEVKILGKGRLTKKLIIEGCKISKKAEEKIKKAGSTIKVRSLKS